MVLDSTTSLDITHDHHHDLWWQCRPLRSVWPPTAAAAPRTSTWFHVTAQTVLMPTAHVNHWSPCGCPQSKLHPKAMVMSRPVLLPRAMSGSSVPTAAGGCVHALCCHQKSPGSPWSVLLLPVKSKGAASAEPWVTVNTQLRKRNMEGLSDNP